MLPHSRNFGARVASFMLVLAVAGSVRAALAQSDTTAKPAAHDSAGDAPVTVAQAEAAGLKLIGVMDANTGDWVDRATVRDTLGNERVTSDIGLAALNELTPLAGYYLLEVRKPGYTPQRFKLKADTAAEFLVALEPNPLGQGTTLPTVVTTAKQTLERDPALRQGFFARCQLASTPCIGRRDLDLRPTEALEGLVSNTPGISLACRTTSRPGDDATCLIKMLKFPLTPGAHGGRGEEYCMPTFFLNGLEWSPLAGGSQQQLNQFVVPANLDGIEIYLSGEPRPIKWSAGPPQCGAIVIWTH